MATLILACGAARGPEFSMRLALGAGHGRLIRQLLIENLVLALVGGACGTIPALRATRVDVIAGLKRQGRGQSGGTGWVRPGKILVVSQVALCVMLLFGAGLFVRSLQKVDAQDDGFDRDRVYLIRVEPRGSDQRNVRGTSERLDGIYRDLIRRVESIEGVRSASLAHFGPTSVVGYSEPLQLPSGETTRIARMMVYPGYFETMGIELVAGRDLENWDLTSRISGLLFGLTATDPLTMAGAVALLTVAAATAAYLPAARAALVDPIVALRNE